MKILIIHSIFDNEFVAFQNDESSLFTVVGFKNEIDFESLLAISDIIISHSFTGCQVFFEKKYNFFEKKLIDLSLIYNPTQLKQFLQNNLGTPISTNNPELHKKLTFKLNEVACKVICVLAMEFLISDIYNADAMNTYIRKRLDEFQTQVHLSNLFSSQ